MERSYQVQNALPKGFRLLWYEILATLGQGSFGVTYLAFDHNLQRETAIKEYLPREFANRDYGDKTIHPLSGKHEKIFHWGMDRFMGEARTLARFKHPNIVRVYTVFEANNTAYMVMEYEQGENLERMFKKGKLTSEKELIGIIIPLLEGLDLIHSTHFIHRDIKPANIYIRSDGSPVLIDFGSARQALGNKTRVLTSLVTPGYAPYEQYYENEEHQGAWSDIYALAATVYLAISGKAPVDALVRGQAMISNDKDPLIPAVVVGSNQYSPQFLAAIDRALMFKETDRPQSTKEWKQMLLGGIVLSPTSQADQDATIEHRSSLITIPESKPIPPIRVHRPRPESRSKVSRNNLSTKRPLLFSISVLGVITTILLGTYIYLKPLLRNQQAYESTPVTSTDEKRVGQREDERQKELVRLLTEANENFGKELWHATLARYQKVLSIDPENHAAKTGITRIAHYHVDLARQSIEKGDIARAKNRLVIAETIIPNMGKVQELKKKIDELERARRAEKVENERIRAEVKNLISSINEAQTRLNKAQALADKVAAKSRARTAYNQAEEYKNQSVALVSQAKKLNQEENYNKAQATFKRASSLIEQATKGYMTAQNIAKLQMEQKTEFNEKRARYHELEALINSAQRAADDAKAEADHIETKIHAPKPYQEAQRWNDQALNLVSKARELQDHRDYDSAIDASTQAIALFNQVSTGYDFARKLAKHSIELSSKPEPFTVHDFEIVRSMLYRFEQAFEQYDLQKLEQMSTLSAERRNLLKMIFQEYRDIEVSISEIAMIASKNSVSATVTITKLQTYTGDQVIPSGHWRQSKIAIYKKGGQWGKINW